MAKILSTIFSKKNRKWTFLVAAAVIVCFFGVRHLLARRSALPKGLASGNGRIESTLIDVSSKLPLKVAEVLVHEGDLVQPGQVLVKMDTITLEAELAQNRAALAGAKEQLAVAGAGITKRQSEISLAKIEKERSRKLVAERAGSQRDYDVRTMTLKTTSAGLAEEQAKLQVAKRNVDAAQANVEKAQSRIDDATLVSPVRGRVLYRLAEPGEVLQPGGKAVTLVNLDDVYMEIFLPANQAAAVKIGSEARIKVDYEPKRVAPGYVSFVSPEAQFTPKEVETRTEREKLMFRVKIQVPRDLVLHYTERIKTGVRGVGYVKTREDAAWPKWLNENLVRADEAPAPPTAPTPPTR
jgi:HlyD family secretion protein